MARRFALALAVLSSMFVVRSAPAATYVVEPSFGRTISGVSLYGGSPVAGSSVGGGGSDLHVGYAWESGWSLFGTCGAAFWSTRSSFGDAIGDRSASVREAYAGLGLRFVLFDREIAPYLQTAIYAESVRVRGANDLDLGGLGAGAQLGARFRDAPWDFSLGLDARRVHLGDDLDLSRITLVLGATVDLLR